MLTKLKQARLARGLSQTALAGLAGRLQTTDISRFELGRALPYAPAAARIARVLGLRPEELLEPATEPLPERPRRARRRGQQRRKCSQQIAA